MADQTPAEKVAGAAGRLASREARKLRPISEGEQKLSDLQKQIKDAVDYYKNLQTTSLPGKIEAVSDKVEAATENLVPKLNEKVFKKWNIRASKVEKVNEDLADFEFGVEDEITASSNSIIYKEVWKLFRKLEWVVGHIAEIGSLIGEALGYLSGTGKIDKFFSDVGGFAVSLFSGDVQQIEDAAGELAADAFEIADYVSRSAVCGLIAELLQGTVAALSAAQYVKITLPVLEVKKATEANIMKKAFPQGTKRHRAIKPSKRN